MGTCRAQRPDGPARTRPVGVTEQHRHSAELAFLIDHDPLTGVANRRRVTGWLAQCTVDDRGGVLLLVDVDDFSDVNDLRGHAVGDQILRYVADTLARRVPAHALLGRTGGDEFAVLVPAVTEDEGTALAGRLRAAGPAHVRPSLRVTVSVGVACIAPDERPRPASPGPTWPSHPGLVAPLRTLGVDDVQGNHFGPPRPLTALLASQ